MPGKLEPVAPLQTPCKCCGATAFLCGVVDFSRNCRGVRHPPFELCGVPIYYHRCPACQFIFTTAFDHLTSEDFLRHIYNAEYTLVDPEYRDVRPRTNARELAKMFRGTEPRRILDYGGGEGLLGEVLTALSGRQVDTYDPFVPRFATRPAHRYDCIVSFEVLEHMPQPAQTLADMNDLLTHEGLILFSTFFQPADINQKGLSWWYVAPRNGHISLYSRESFLKLAQPFGLRLASLNDHVHALFRRVPDFASLPGLP